MIRRTHYCKTICELGNSALAGMFSVAATTPKTTTLKIYQQSHTVKPKYRVMKGPERIASQKKIATLRGNPTNVPIR